MTGVAVREATPTAPRTNHHAVRNVLHSMVARHGAATAMVAAVLAFWGLLLGSMQRDWVPNDARMLYLPTARNLLRHGRYSVMDQAPYLPTITKMPGYSFFLAAEQAVFGDGLGPLRVVQFCLVGLTALVAADIARRLFDARTAMVTAVLVSVYPSFAVHAMAPLSEALTCLLATAFVDALVAARGAEPRPAPHTPDTAHTPHTAHTATGAGRAPVVVLGTTLGLLVLVRQSFAFLAPVAVVVVLAAERRRCGAWRPGLRRALVVGVLAGVLVVPWCARNIAVTGRPLPFGANSGLSLLVSVRQYAGDPLQRPSYLPTVTEALTAIDAGDPPEGTAPGLAEGVGGGPAREAALDARLTEIARQEAGEVPPARWLSTVPARLTVLWSGATFLQPLDRFELVLTLASAVAGLVVLAKRSAVWPLWLLAVSLSAFHLLFHAEARYSLPARPALLVFGAAALVAIARLPHRRATAGRVTGAARRDDGRAP